MCMVCFREYEKEYGPAIFSEEAYAVSALIERLYDEESYVGGNLHIVLDESNLEDCHIESCLEPPYYHHDETLTDLEREIGERLLAMTMPERNAAVHISDGIPPLSEEEQVVTVTNATLTLEGRTFPLRDLSLDFDVSWGVAMPFWVLRKVGMSERQAEQVQSVIEAAGLVVRGCEQRSIAGVEHIWIQLRYAAGHDVGLVGVLGPRSLGLEPGAGGHGLTVQDLRFWAPLLETINRILATEEEE